MEWVLSAETRARVGKSIARKLRREQKVPAIIYGPKIERPIPVALGTNQVVKLLTAMGDETKVVNLAVKREDGKEEQFQVLVKDVQTHPFKRRLLHVDFYALPADQDVDVDVPVDVVGEAIGVKKGGILNVVLHSLSIRCWPSEIPEKIEVDVSNLDIGDVLHVEDIRDQFSFKILNDDDAPIVAVTPPEGFEAPSESGEEESTESGE
ncbi:MAG: 50S ribosomal protein L25/general stress protein Ctc [Deltaproteobacteria bacterium]|nr:50S ribosomal protein L25/general stress protein Ctc [Deltaproteobacteria bacterium]MBW2067951.1 50S ribosomal protein L25/general stress protein Ctc [Deltaproteobacteria bacterium]